MLVIIDYNMGNLFSVSKVFERLGVNAKVSRDIRDIKRASKLLLPGVGFFKNGMEQLAQLELIEALTEKVLDNKTPILGICLGMQLFTKHSDEGNVNGLGWINAKASLLSFDNKSKNHIYKVPHMGWNTLESDFSNPLLTGLNEQDSFYFAHSFCVDTPLDESLVATTHYGQIFTTVFNKDNIYGVQFHPEKSHQAGIKLLKNFLEKC